MQEKDMIQVGKIGKPIGLKGEANFISYVEDTKWLQRLMTDLEDQSTELTWSKSQGLSKQNAESSNLIVEYIKPRSGSWIIKLQGIADRDEMKAYTHYEVSISRGLLPSLNDEDFYWADLEGLQVQNEKGEQLGHVLRLMETGSNDVLVIAPSQLVIEQRNSPVDHEQEELLLPYIWQQTILSVDLNAGMIKVDWPIDYWD